MTIVELPPDPPGHAGGNYQRGGGTHPSPGTPGKEVAIPRDCEDRHRTAPVHRQPSSRRRRKAAAATTRDAFRAAADDRAGSLATLALANPDCGAADYQASRAGKRSGRKAHGDYRGIVARASDRAEELKPQKDGTFTSDKTTFVASRQGKDRQIHGQGNMKVTASPPRSEPQTGRCARRAGSVSGATELATTSNRTAIRRVESGKGIARSRLSQSARLMGWRTSTACGPVHPRRGRAPEAILRALG